jgi:hypothetical protein
MASDRFNDITQHNMISQMQGVPPRVHSMMVSRLLPLATCHLPLASCLLPLASCLLPLASCLLPLASCLFLLGVIDSYIAPRFTRFRSHYQACVRVAPCALRCRQCGRLAGVCACVCLCVSVCVLALQNAYITFVVHHITYIITPYDITQPTTMQTVTYGFGKFHHEHLKSSY